MKEKIEIIDHLQTLEDKVKFIMEHTYYKTIVGMSIDERTLQDLWDEEKKEQTIKECNCDGFCHTACACFCHGKQGTATHLPDNCNCHTNLTKEEIMEELEKTFSIGPAEIVYSIKRVAPMSFRELKDWLSKTLDKLNVK